MLSTDSELNTLQLREFCFSQPRNRVSPVDVTLWLGLKANIFWPYLDLDLDLGPPVPAGTLGDERSPLPAVTSNRLGLLPADIRRL